MKSGKDAESSKDSQLKENMSLSTSKDASQSQHKSSGKSVHVEEPSYTVEDSCKHKIKSSSWGITMNNMLTRRLPKLTEPPTSFDEFNDTSFDFSAFVLNRHIQEILVGPAFNLLKGTCNSIIELEYHLEECYKATTERLDWHNPKNKLYPFDLRKPFMLIQDHRGRQIISKNYFINKDLEYLKGGDSSRRYTTFLTKTKAATYKLKWIEDLVPELWSPCHLEEIEVHRDDHQLYTFKEGDFKRLRLQDIEDMLLLLVQQKSTNRTIDERYDLNVALHQFKRKILMHTDELHKFSDGTLNDVQTALYDIVARIRMDYLPMQNGVT
uniref:Uncharacterized protein n=1 Tax=Tanacetum cinerariifolium TaxID=118510 RepID=A0A6L2J1R4_TANCI|nr:hypothetical protein [Tanacetum cinerariifolium]